MIMRQFFLGYSSIKYVKTALHVNLVTREYFTIQFCAVCVNLLTRENTKIKTYIGFCRYIWWEKNSKGSFVRLTSNPNVGTLIRLLPVASGCDGGFVHQGLRLNALRVTAKQVTSLVILYCYNASCRGVILHRIWRIFLCYDRSCNINICDLSSV